MSVVQNHQINVLVVDPDSQSRVQIHEVLISDGYACRAVSTVAAAVDAAAENAPNLLVCDMNIGEDSGLELFAKINQMAECPVVFLSDSRRPETVQRARKAGATYFLSKPFDPAVLMELVDKALWMPHLVRRHVDSVAHQIKAPTFAPSMAKSSSGL